MPLIPAIRNQLLQLRINEQLNKPPNEGDWAEVETLLKQFSSDPAISDVQKAVVTVSCASCRIV